MILERNNIELRSITIEDTDLIIKWRNKESVKKHFLYQQPFTREGHIKWLNEMVFSGKTEQFIIIDKAEDKSIGSVFLRDIDYDNKKAEYGIFIGEDLARSRGIGTLVAKMIVEYGFEQLKLHKIFLRVFADNERAIKCYNKAGFKKEGYFKEEIIIDNKYRDIVFMAIFNKTEDE